MSIEFSLTASVYMCEPCTMKQGTPVTELVRMIKHPAILNGRMVGDEHWGCPICLEEKFPVKQTRAKPPEVVSRPPRSKPKLVSSRD